MGEITQLTQTRAFDRMAIFNRLRGNPWVVMMVLCLVLFMALLDTTIVNIAVPSIINGIDASLDEVLWVLNAYVLVFAALLITAGRLREGFVAGFGKAAEGGLEMGANGPGGGAQVQRLAEEAFRHGFVDAMHPTQVLPIAVVPLASLSCLAIRRGKHAAQPEPGPYTSISRERRATHER